MLKKDKTKWYELISIKMENQVVHSEGADRLYTVIQYAVFNPTINDIFFKTIILSTTPIISQTDVTVNPSLEFYIDNINNKNMVKETKNEEGFIKLKFYLTEELYKNIFI